MNIRLREGLVNNIPFLFLLFLPILNPFKNRKKKKKRPQVFHSLPFAHALLQCDTAVFPICKWSLFPPLWLWIGLVTSIVRQNSSEGWHGSFKPRLQAALSTYFLESLLNHPVTKHQPILLENEMSYRGEGVCPRAGILGPPVPGEGPCEAMLKSAKPRADQNHLPKLSPNFQLTELSAK